MRTVPPTVDGVDPRIAAAGGVPVRADGAGGYNYPGMQEFSNWRKTRAHEHASSYSCARCGQAFHSPHAVYTHLAKRHPPRSGRVGGLRPPRDAGRARNAPGDLRAA
jgi:hypothetical protein